MRYVILYIGIILLYIYTLDSFIKAFIKTDDGNHSYFNFFTVFFIIIHTIAIIIGFGWLCINYW